ncbi:MAG TPA: vitamin K epoxide reductase family protein [Candidatus Paceibacterota bacterium]
MQKSFAYILIVFGVVGLLASSQLMWDTVKLAQDPGIDLPCNLSPFVSCTSINTSSQSKVFGFPNPIMGIAGFSAIITIGLLSLFGAIPDRRFWKIFTIGMTLATIFIHWLIIQSIFVIGNLCLYCMITWAAIWPIFIFTISNFYPNSLVSKNKPAFLAGWYLLIILIILVKFREYFF